MQVHSNPDFQGRPDFDPDFERRRIVSLSRYIVDVVNDRPEVPFGHLDARPLEEGRGARFHYQAPGGHVGDSLRITETGPSEYEISLEEHIPDSMQGMTEVKRLTARVSSERAKLISTVQFNGDYIGTEAIRSLPPKLPAISGVLYTVQDAMNVEIKKHLSVPSMLNRWVRSKLRRGQTA